MSLQNMIYSNNLVGTSSSGASLIPYEKQWKHRDHDDVNILLGSPRLSEHVDTNIGSDTQLGFPSYARHTFHSDRTTGMPRWRDVLRFLRQLEPTTAYIVITEPQKPIGINTWWDRFTTVDIDQEDSYKQIIQYLQRCDILERFDVLTQREDNWDGYDSKKPTESTIVHAKKLMEEFLDSIASAGHLWLTPFISSDEDGCVTVEWYEEERELHLLIGENEAEYLQVWGTNIDTEMHVDFLCHDDYLTLWDWLLHG